MILLSTFKISIRALLRNSLRTLLTMLGIIIGVGAVIAMVSIGNGARSQVEAQVASLGQNVIQVLAGTVSRGGVRMSFGTAATLTREDYDAIRKEVVGISGISPEVRAPYQVTLGNQNVNTQVLGVGSDYLYIRAWPITDGENFTESDVRAGNKVALLGATVANELFGGASPVGEIVRIKNAPFKVLGVLSSKGMNLFGSDQDDVVLVPEVTSMKKLSNQTNYRSLSVQVSNPADNDSVQAQITALLRERHRITPDKDDDFIVRTQQEISEAASATARVMTALLGSIASVSLLVGGIGIMNIMLVSVTERTREIGIRLAVGARGGDILLQFLIEAVSLSILGGVIGIVLGVGASRIVASRLNWPTLTSTNSIVLAFVFSAAVGIFFGFYPARKASRLDPIEALRYE